MSLVASDLICKPKSKGGLGIKQITAWKTALMGKYVWDISSKADRLRVRWVNHVYIKNATWLEYGNTSTASWS